MFNFFGGSKKPYKDDIKSNKGMKDEESNFNPSLGNNKQNVHSDYYDDNIPITEDDLNDPELLAELQKYGNQDEGEPNKKVSTISPKKHLNPPINNKAECNNLLDMNSAVDVDDVEVTEDDFKDPVLLAELAKYGVLCGESVEVEGNIEIQLETKVDHVIDLSATPPASLDIPTEIMQPNIFPAQLSIQPASDTQKNIATSLVTNSANPTTFTYPLVADITTSCTPEIAKQNAKLCMQAGASVEALEWMKVSKTLNIQNPAKQLLASQPRVTQPKQSTASTTLAPMSKSVPVATAATTRPARVGTETRTPTAAVKSPANSSKVTSITTALKSVVTSENKSMKANTIPVTSHPAPNPLAVPAPTTTLSDIFTPLELALQESSTLTLTQAKEFKISHQDTKAIEKMKLYKDYQQELTVLNSRRQIPGARPPLFHWEERRKEIKIEHIDLGDDQIELSILSLDDIQATLDAHSSRSLSITYTIPTGKDTQATGNTNIAKYKDGKAIFSFKVLIDMNKQKSTINLFSKKKAKFQINLHVGLFSSSTIVLGAAIFPLSELLTHCSCGGNIQLLKEEGSKKAIGGLLQAYFRLRRPIERPEITYVTESVLVVGPWPEVVDVTHLMTVAATAVSSSMVETSPLITPPLTQSPMITSDIFQSPDINTLPINNDNLIIVPPPTTITVSPSPTNTPITVIPPPSPSSSSSSTTTTTTTSNKNATLTKQLGGVTPFPLVSEEEKEDPLSLDFIVSNDVLEAEIKNITTYLTTHNKLLSGDELSQLQTRKMLTELKLSALETKVVNGSITFEEYLEIIKTRFSRDKQLFAYCKSLNMINEANSIFERMKIMKNEIEGAERSMMKENAT